MNSEYRYPKSNIALDEITFDCLYLAENNLYMELRIYMQLGLYFFRRIPIIGDGSSRI